MMFSSQTLAPMRPFTPDKTLNPMSGIMPNPLTDNAPNASIVNANAPALPAPSVSVPPLPAPSVFVRMVDKVLETEAPDRFQSTPPLQMRQSGNATHIITFRGLQNPLTDSPLALQMKVRGVTRHQGGLGEVSGPIGRLAASAWKDGQPMEHKLRQSQILLSIPRFGPVGQVPPEIAKRIQNLLQKYPSQFRFELSNLIAGTSQGASTIGMRVNLVYVGQAEELSQRASRRGGNRAFRSFQAQAKQNPELETERAFKAVLNDPACRDVVLPYQPKTSPEEVLKRILSYEKATRGDLAAQQMTQTIDTITAKLKDPTNRRILLLGHCKPDGDTLGCVVGLKNAIELMDPTRTVDCAVDDRIPGLFRDKIPGIQDIKHPDDPGKREQIGRMILALQEKLKQPSGRPEDRPELLRSQIRALENEQNILSNPANLLKPNDQYDLVVTLDIPTPTRFTDRFKPYLQSAKDAIYIDHHPFRYNEWEAAKNETGLDIEAVKQKKLAWVAESVGACTQMVGILGNRLVPGFQQMANGQPSPKAFRAFSKSPSHISGSQISGTQASGESGPFAGAAQRDRLTKYVAALSTGTCTDTSSFTRTANLTVDDMQKPVEKRPDFRPEGMVKWLMGMTEKLPSANRIDKKWLRENVTYGVSDKAHALMQQYARAGVKEYPPSGLGVIQVDYDAMNAVWQTALEQDGAVTLLDIQNEFKYSELMSALKGSPHGKTGGGGFQVSRILPWDFGKRVGKSAEKSADRGNQSPNRPQSPSDSASNASQSALSRPLGKRTGGALNPSTNPARKAGNRNQPLGFPLAARPASQDKIAVLICQDRKKGELDEKLQIATENGLRLSLRSGNGTDSAELLAGLFGGGGHGAAAGARVDLPNVQLDTPLGVMIRGQRVTDPAAILKVLKDNLAVTHDARIPVWDKANRLTPITIIADPQGKPCADLLADLATALQAGKAK